jgi:CheY-like chemotaxis protein
VARVLVVDDSDIIARLLVTLLEQHGHEAIDAAERYADLLDPGSDLWAGTSVLITDLRMPVISGVELLAHARVYHPGVYRIVLTGWDRDPDALEVVEDLADKVLVKPRDVLAIPVILAERA